MKQYITVKQLGELTENQITKLCTLITDDIGVLLVDTDETIAEMTTIGKMIEILEQHGEYPNIYISNNPGVKTWEVQSVPYTDAFEKEELCDALFEAIKTIL